MYYTYISVYVCASVLYLFEYIQIHKYNPKYTFKCDFCSFKGTKVYQKCLYENKFINNKYISTTEVHCVHAYNLSLKQKKLNIEQNIFFSNKQSKIDYSRHLLVPKNIKNGKSQNSVCKKRFVNAYHACFVNCVHTLICANTLITN